MAVERTPVIVRKRKRNDFAPQHTPQRTPVVSVQQLRRKDWTVNPGGADATQNETTGLMKAAMGMAAHLVHKALSRFQQKDDSRNSPSQEDADSKDDLKETRKKRKVDTFATPVKRPSVRQALEDMPLISEKVDIQFVQSPIDWNLESMEHPTSMDYGTSFIKSKKVHGSNKVAEHLRSVYKGQFRPSPMQSPSPVLEPLDQKLGQRITSLTGVLQRFFKDKAQHTATRRDDDVIFLKEVRLPPTRSTFSFKFDTDDLTFKNDFSTYQRLLRERKEQGERIHKEVLEASKPKSRIFQALDEEQEQEVINIWKGKGRDQQLLVQRCDVDVRVCDIKTLADGKWLNDIVIDVYLKLITNDKVHAFSTYFFTTLEGKGYKGVQKWMKRAKKDISKLDMILCPINVHKTHWVTGAIDLKRKQIVYLDSLAGHETSHGSMALKLLGQYLEGEATKQGHKGLGEGFAYRQITECPQQTNGSDCGVFTLLNSLCLTVGEPFDYQPMEAKTFRRLVAHRILHG